MANPKVSAGLAMQKITISLQGASQKANARKKKRTKTIAKKSKEKESFCFFQELCNVHHHNAGNYSDVHGHDQENLWLKLFFQM